MTTDQIQELIANELSRLNWELAHERVISTPNPTRRGSMLFVCLMATSLPNSTNLMGEVTQNNMLHTSLRCATTLALAVTYWWNSSFGLWKASHSTSIPICCPNPLIDGSKWSKSFSTGFVTLSVLSAWLSWQTQNSRKTSQFLTTSAAGSHLGSSARIGYLKLLPLKCAPKACTGTCYMSYRWANIWLFKNWRPKRMTCSWR